MKKRLLSRFTRGPHAMDPAAAYDLWAATYDDQPANLMFHLDNLVLDGLLGQVDLAGKIVLDVGCGTGRHWEKILKLQPAALIGYDVSKEMRTRLHQKIPQAQTWPLRGHALKQTPDASCDVILSTLVLAHIEDLAGAFAEWNRVLARPGKIIITDYHPAALAKGADRTFKHQDDLVAIRNYVHPLPAMRALISRLGWQELAFMERPIDESVRSWYEKQNALPVYERFRDTPIIFGWLLTKT